MAVLCADGLRGRPPLSFLPLATEAGRRGGTRQEGKRTSIAVDGRQTSHCMRRQAQCSICEPSRCYSPPAAVPHLAVVCASAAIGCTHHQSAARCSVCRSDLFSDDSYVSVHTRPGLLTVRRSAVRTGCALPEASRASNDAEGVTGSIGGNEERERGEPEKTKEANLESSQRTKMHLSGWLMLAHSCVFAVVQKPRASTPPAPSWPLSLLPRPLLRPLSCSSASMAEARRSVVCDALAPDAVH
jgi:hypothetical protein